MEYEQQLRRFTSNAAATATTIAGEPGRSSRSAALCKCQRPVPSGLVNPIVSARAEDPAGLPETTPQATGEVSPPAEAPPTTAFAPPRLGMVTEQAIHRAGPTTRSARLGTIAPRTVAVVRSEVQTTDAAHPRWFGVEVDQRQGFVAASLIRLEDLRKDAEPTASATQGTEGAAPAAGAPVPAVVSNPDSPLFSGHLARMRGEGEFLQIAPAADGRTLHKASTRALATKGYSGTTLASKAKVFRDAACNILALFFIEHASTLKSYADALPQDYAAYRQVVEDAMANYFTGALRSGLVRESAWVTSNAALDQNEGCGSKDTPYQKAQGLLKCEGRLLRIHVGGHFFVGEVKDGVLHAYDNQGDSRKRSGEFNLQEVTPESTSGTAYRYLRDVLVSASPEKASAKKPAAGQAARPSQTIRTATDEEPCAC